MIRHLALYFVLSLPQPVALSCESCECVTVECCVMRSRMSISDPNCYQKMYELWPQLRAPALPLIEPQSETG